LRHFGQLYCELMILEKIQKYYLLVNTHTGLLLVNQILTFSKIGQKLFSQNRARGDKLVELLIRYSIVGDVKRKPSSAPLLF